MDLWQFLALSLAVSFATASRSMAVAAILLANWCINTSAAVLTGSQFNWQSMACVDYVSGLLILVVASSRWAVCIAILYAVEMIAHVAYGLSSQGAWPQYRYWWMLHYAAWSQAWLLFAWSVIDGGKVVRDRFNLTRFMEPVDALRYRLGLHRDRDR